MKMIIGNPFRRPRSVNPVAKAGAAVVTRNTEDVLDGLEAAYWDAVTTGTATAQRRQGLSVGQGVRIRKASLERNLMRSMLMHELEAQNELDALRHYLGSAYASREKATQDMETRAEEKGD